MCAVVDDAMGDPAAESTAMTRAVAKPQAKATAETRLRARTATAVATPALHRTSWPQDQRRARGAARAVLTGVDLTSEEVSSACSEDEGACQHTSAIDSGARASRLPGVPQATTQEMLPTDAILTETAATGAEVKVEPVGAEAPCEQFSSAELRGRLPVDPRKCMGRIWNDGFLAQCSCARLAGQEFCSTHQRSIATHGRIDNPVEPALARKAEKHRARARRGVKDRWYSRLEMWERLRLSSAYYDGIMNVDDLSDEQFGALMDQVHTHLSKHPNLRTKSALEANRGPDSAAERGTGAALYVGTPLRYTYFGPKSSIRNSKPYALASRRQMLPKLSSSAPSPKHIGAFSKTVGLSGTCRAVAYTGAHNVSRIARTRCGWSSIPSPGLEDHVPGGTSARNPAQVLLLAVSKVQQVATRGCRHARLVLQR